MLAVDLVSREDALTLRTLLKRPLFASARVLVGLEHLDNPVRWVHVGEILDVASYLHGQELILCTGVAIRRPQDWLSYLESLAACRASAVCIELGRYVQAVPDEALGLAEHLGLPIIAFSEPVRFVDITEDVHALLVQEERDAQASVHALGESLRRLLPGPTAPQQILRRLAEWLDRPVAFRLYGEKTTIVGPRAHEERWKKRLRVPCVDTEASADTKDERVAEGGYIIRRNATAMDLSLAMVATWCTKAELPYVPMAVDMAAASLAQELFRQRTVEEERFRQRETLLRQVLSGQGSAVRLVWESACDLKHGEEVPLAVQVVAVEDFGAAMVAPSAELHALLRERFLRRGYRVLFGTEGRRTFAVIPVSAFSPGLREALPVVFAPGSGLKEPHYGVGRPVGWDELSESYHEADLALSIGQATDWTTDPFYAALGTYRILFNLRHDFDLQGFVEDELGPVLAYDRAHGSDLIQTLSALLAAAGRKEVAAARLAIHRQTLYYRIGKLQDLLGGDFLAAGRRTAIDLAMLAKNLLERRRVSRLVPDAASHHVATRTRRSV